MTQTEVGSSRFLTMAPDMPPKSGLKDGAQQPLPHSLPWARWQNQNALKFLRWAQINP